MNLVLCLAAALTALACRTIPDGRSQELSLRVAGFVKASGIT